LSRLIPAFAHFLRLDRFNFLPKDQGNKASSRKAAEGTSEDIGNNRGLAAHRLEPDCVSARCGTSEPGKAIFRVLQASRDGNQTMPDISAGRLETAELNKNFTDIHPPLDRHEAVVESDRCYFCYDAPCTIACPTSIDIPLFIRKISTGNVDGAAETIFSSNILGGMCARVCPTEELCEEACVRNTAEEKPVRIGLLQRFATDHYIGGHDHFGTRATATGKTVAVVGRVLQASPVRTNWP
jgi:hypothetical protein